MKRDLSSGKPDHRHEMESHTGGTLASDSFLSKLEALLGRRLRALPPGRPRTGKSHASRE